MKKPYVGAMVMLIIGVGFVGGLLLPRLNADSRDGAG